MTDPRIDPETGEFKLEPSPPKGEIPQRVVDELINARTVAKDDSMYLAKRVSLLRPRSGGRR